MSGVSSLLSQPGIEATFVPGRPARAGHLALWHPERSPEDFTDVIDVVAPDGDRLRQRQVPALLLPIRRVIDALVDLDADAPSGGSVHSWARATRGALAVIAEGKLLPTVDEDGIDGWRLGPLAEVEVAWLDRMAASMDPAAHATAVAGSAPRRVASPRWLLARWWDAVADAYVRTAGASRAVGHDAYAVSESVLVLAGGATSGVAIGADEAPAWLLSTSAAAASGVTVALRLVDGHAPPDAANDLDRPTPTGPTPTPTPDAPEDRPGGVDHPATVDGSGFVAVVEVASVVDPSLVLDAADLWRAGPAVASRFGPAAETDVLLALRRGTRAWPPLDRLLSQPRPDRMALSDGEADDLLGPAADALTEAGVEVRWPAGVLADVTVTPVVAATTVGSDRESGIDLASMCELRWDASIDGQKLDPDEHAALVAAKRGIVRLRGRWVRADPERLGRLARRRSIGAGQALAAALSGGLTVDGTDVDAVVEGPLAELGQRLRNAPDRTTWTPPEGLHATLRPYQQDGVAWLSEMADLGLGGVLADDMGLGKTLQLLALHLRSADATGAATLVVCPVSVLGNWAREAERFTPEVPVLRYHGTSRSLDHLPTGALVLTTYGVARREAAELARHRWGLVAADEAQAIKNPLSRTAKALRLIPARARFALTGTPVENRLVDLWALLDWTTPGLLGQLDHFRREVALPVERERDPDAAAELAALVRPFLLRRRKSDPGIAPDLPPKTETDRVVPLTLEQATLYEATVAEILAQIETAEGMARRGLILKLMTGLKQICNHPAQFLRQSGPLPGRSGKLDAVTELVETITSEGEAVLVFTQYVAMGELLVEHLGGSGSPPPFLHGGVSARGRQEMVDRFQAGENPVFVISLKAGGTGLNLTRATHVVHYDRWWNPAVEDQASDRAWRIGQDRPVQVHRMVCEGTVEDRIAALLTDKRSLADAVVTAGEGWISELGDADLRRLVALGGDGGGLGSERGGMF